MICERVEDLLSALIDNEIDPTAKTEVEQHLKQCPQCAEAYRELSLLVTTSSSLEPIAPPDRVFMAVRSRIRHSESRSWLRPRSVGWVLVPALATVVLMLIVLPRERPSGKVVLEHPVIQPAGESAKVEPNLAALPAASARPERLERSVLRAASRPAQSRSSEARIVNRSPVSYAIDVVPAQPIARSVSSVGSASDMVMVASSESRAPAGDVRASLRVVQQGLEEIEAALHANPGNPQVIQAYRATYRKGQELKDRYLAGAR